MGGSSKKQTVGYRYRVGMHVVLCHGPVDYLLEIKVDDRLAWSGRAKQGRLTISKPDLFGGDSREGGVSGDLDFLSGGPTQGVNDYLLAKLGGLVPAFRGVAGLVLRQVYVGVNPYLKNWAFRLKRIHTRQNGLKQWYDGKAEINGDAFTADPSAYSVEYSGGSVESIAYSPEAEAWLAAGSMASYLRSDDDGDNWSLASGPSGDASNEVAVSGMTVVCSCSGFSKCWVSVNGGASFTVKSIPAPFGSGNTRTGCVAYGNGVWMIGGQYAGQGYVTISADGGNTWSPIPGSGDQNFVGAFPVLSVCHVEGSRWLCCDSSGRVHVSSTGGAYWSQTSKLFVHRLRKLSVGIAAIHLTPSISISKDGGDTWGPSVALPFQPYDVAQLNELLVAVGAGGQIALSYDQGVSWEAVPQVLAGGNSLRSIATNGENIAFAGGGGGVVAKIKIVPARKGDMNPAHIIRECLTDPDWGMGYQEADIDDVAFKAAADRLFAEGMGISMLWDRQVPLEDFVKEVIKHIDGALYVDRITGRFVLKLIRADYHEAGLLTLGPSNIERVEGYARPAFGELVNSVTVNYWSTDSGKTASVTVDDPAMIQMQGCVIGTTIQYPGFTNGSIATRAAQRDLRALSTPLLSCTIHAARAAAALNIGDVFKFEWPDYHDGHIVMRVTGLALGDGRSNKVRISCTQDVFALPDVAVVVPPQPEWQDPVQPPQPVVHQLAFEVPYRELVQQMGQASADSVLASGPETSFLGVAAARADNNSISARLFVDAGAGFDDVGGLDFCPAALLVSAVDAFQTEWELTAGQDLELLEIGTWGQVGGEIVYVEAIDGAAVTVKRAIMDTVPASHPVGAVVYFWDAAVAGDGIEYLAGETLGVKLTPLSGSGQVDLAAASAMSLSMVGRAWRPYRPGNLKGNGVYRPGVDGDLVFPVVLTWAHRNRLQDTAGEPIGYYEGSITPEAATTYTVRVVELDNASAEGLTLHVETGLTGETWGLDYSVVELSDATAFLIGVRALRGGVESWEESRLIIPGALQAPTGLVLDVEEY